MAFVLLASFLFSALSFWAISSRLGLVDVDRPARQVLIAAGMGPLMLALILSSIMTWLPGLSRAFYLGSVLAILTLLVFFGRVGLQQTILVLVSRTKLISRDSTTWTGALVALILLFAMAIYAVYAFPLYANDPLEYFQASRLIYQQMDMSQYPFVDGSAGRGFYGPWTHPPGYVSLLVWADLIQGHADFPGIARMPTLYFSAVTILLLAGIGGSTIGLVAAFLLLSVPIYFVGVATSHIDPVRIFPTVTAFFLLQELKDKLDLKHAVALGFVIGLGIFVHSIGMLLLPMVAVILLIWGREKLYRKMIWLIGVGLLSLSIVSPSLIANMRNFDSPIADNTVVWKLPQIKHKEHLEYARRISTPTEKILFGILKGFTKPRSYSFSYWLFAFACVLFVFRRYKFSKCDYGSMQAEKEDRIDNTQLLSLAVVIIWGSMALIATALGSDAFIKNDRYPLTIQPFIALFTATVICRNNVQLRQSE